MTYNKTSLPELVSLKTVVSIFRRTIDWHVPPEWHDFYEISYVESGETHTLVDGVRTVIKEGQLILFAPNSSHGSPDGYKGKRVTLNNVCFEGDIGILNQHVNRPIDLTGAQRKHLLEIVERGAVHFERVQGMRGMVIKSGVSEYELKRLKNELELFLVSVVESIERGNGVASNTKKHINESFSRLNEYLTDSIGENPSTADMAAALSVSTSTLKSICHAGSGMSPTAYFIYLKIKRAKELIKESSMNFTEIADFLGFSSLHYFSKLFKDKVGITPTEYAKSGTSDAISK